MSYVIAPSGSPIEMSSAQYDDDDDVTPIIDQSQSLPDITNGGRVTIRAPTSTVSSCVSYATVGILFLVNLLNYMDRYTLSGVLIDVQHTFQIHNSEAGLLQTAFICSYMILSPIFGYLGDRYPRKAIMASGILFWCAVTLGSSFVTKDQFGIFMFLRACVGVGEASYSTIAPTIIADMFITDQRSNMLAIFYFAIPVGSGLGYIIGANVAKLLGDWRWALRVTPAFGLLAVLLIVLLVRDPPRGHAEGGSHLQATSWRADVIQLCKNKTFLFTTLGFTAVAFVAGAFAFWSTAFVIYSIQVQQRSVNEAYVALVFGVITCAAGFIGVALGSQVAKFMRRFNPRADPLVCAAGLLLCTPFLYASLIVSQYNTTATWVLIFLGETLLCLNWSVVADIILYVVIPTRRSTAEALQILLSHALGDAGSPSLIGAISDSIKNPDLPNAASMFLSLRYALYMTCFVSVLGGGCFLAAALFVEEDKARVDLITQKSGPVIMEGALSDCLDTQTSDEAPDDIRT